MEEKKNRKCFADVPLTGQTFLTKLELFFALFIVCAFIGFLYEEVYCLVVDGNLKYRGTLWGPVLPLYGGGGIMLYVLFHRVRKAPDIVFFGSAVTTGMLEYVVGRILLAITGKKYWTYYGAKYIFDSYNFVSLRSVLIFAIGSMLMLYGFSSPLFDLLLKAKAKTRHIVCGIAAGLFITDVILSLLIPNTLGQI